MSRKQSSAEADKPLYSRRGFYLRGENQFWHGNEYGMSYPQHVKDYYDNLVRSFYPRTQLDLIKTK